MRLGQVDRRYEYSDVYGTELKGKETIVRDIVINSNRDDKAPVIEWWVSTFLNISHTAAETNNQR